MSDFEQRFQLFCDAPKYPTITQMCSVIGFCGDSSSHFWIMEERIFYYDGVNWYLMKAFNEWVRDYDFAEPLIYDSDIECVFPIPAEVVEQYGFKYLQKDG